jgi:drug/metabolite transporter (DMT)-like permease
VGVFSIVGVVPPVVHTWCRLILFLLECCPNFSHVGAVTSSVLNTAKRVIIIVVSAVVFQEAMERNTVIGSAIAIGGTFAYSLTSSTKEKPKAKAA